MSSVCIAGKMPKYSHRGAMLAQKRYENRVSVEGKGHHRADQQEQSQSFWFGDFSSVQLSICVECLCCAMPEFP